MDIEQELEKYIKQIKLYASQMYLESAVSDKEDLEQAGKIGMINGLNSFSVEKAKQAGTKKSTYIIQCIRNAIMQEANKFYGPTSLPHNKRLRLNAFKKLLGRGVEEEDIKTAMKMSDVEFENLMTIVKVGKVVPVPDSIIDSASADFDNVTLSSLLEGVDLNDDERQLLAFKLDGKTYSQIAEYYELSRETMRKRVHKVLEKIRNKVQANG